MTYEYILLWFFVGVLIIAFTALAFFIILSLYRMSKLMDKYNKYAAEEAKKGHYVPPFPASR